MATPVRGVRPSMIVLTPLVAIFAYLVYQGNRIGELGLPDADPEAAGRIGGGMANAIVGSVLILAIGSLLGVPSGSAPASIWRSSARNRFGDRCDSSPTC